jgi:hypothetical protein
LEEKLKVVEFKFFIGDRVWYRSMNRVGEVVACSFSRDHGYRYTVRIAYQGKWEDQECDEAHLLPASEHLDSLLTRYPVTGHSCGDRLSDTTCAHTGQ